MAPSDLVARLFETLRQTTSDPPGVTRVSYGPGEQQAHDLARQEAERLGLEALNDAAGNLYLTWRGTDPDRHAFSKVAGEVAFCLDGRSQSLELLHGLQDRTRALCAEISARRGVHFDLGELSDSAPAMMDPGLLAALEGASRHIGLAATVLARGAGHDAAVVANAGIPSAMIIVRNRHGSHNPEEAMDLEDFDLAVALLCRFLTDFD